MRIGVFAEAATLEQFVNDATDSAQRGFSSVWAPQISRLDALTAIAVAAREVPLIEFGTAVIPTYPRHPTALAMQALTTQEAAAGRLTLGIGLSHQITMEGMLAISMDKPVRHLREYLSILMPLLHGETVSFEGETLTAKFGIQGDTAARMPVPVLVAALGPQMLALTGRFADGTATWMTGPDTIGSHVVPSIRRAAADAGRPDPRVVVALPTCVTDDVDEAREKAANIFQIYGFLPSYRAMLDREGAAGPGDVAIVGNEKVVRSAIEEIFERGATEFVVVPFSNRDRTLDCAAELLA